MKVNVSQANTDVGSIKYGECFWYKGLLYMRIVPDCKVCDANLVPTVLLTTGSILWVSPDVQVERCDCIIVSSDLIPQEKDKFEI